MKSNSGNLRKSRVAVLASLAIVRSYDNEQREQPSIVATATASSEFSELDYEGLIEFYSFLLKKYSPSKRDGDGDSSDSSGDGDEADDGDEDGTDSQVSNFDFCQVCSKLGELVCCSSCPYSFHLHCIRPQIRVLPKGEWSCAHCHVAGRQVVKRGRKMTLASAKRGIREMEMIQSGIGTEGNCEEDESEADKKESVRGRGSKRKVAEVESSPESVSTDPPIALQGVRSKRFRKQPLMYDPQMGAASRWKTDGPSEWKTTSKYNCCFCRDDANIAVCPYCACRVCFGKHKASSIILCDRCDDEYHVTCLSPPLKKVPAKQWFCPNCVKQASPSASKLKSSRSQQKKTNNQKDNTVAETFTKGGLTSDKETSPNGNDTSNRKATDRENDIKCKGSVAIKDEVKKSVATSKQLTITERTTTEKESDKDTLSVNSSRASASATISEGSNASKLESPTRTTIRSRSGRVVKKKTFLIEEEEGEQHLRAGRSSNDANTKKALPNKNEKGNSIGANDKSDNGSSEAKVPKSKNQNDSKLSSMLSVPPGSSSYERLPSMRIPGLNPAFPIPLVFPPSVSNSISARAEALKKYAKLQIASVSKSSKPPIKVSTGVTGTSNKNEKKSNSAANSQTASGDSTKNKPSVQFLSPITGQPLSKEPRRKPGARECMQISRRFGVNIIPDKYMEVLIDYCSRGKLEHLIRMRERLDDHSKFLEYQLSAFEELVRQKQNSSTELDADKATLQTAKEKK